MQHTVCEQCFETLNESSALGTTQQQVINVSDAPLDAPLDTPHGGALDKPFEPFDAPRSVLRDKSDRSRKMRLASPIQITPITAGHGFGHRLGLGLGFLGITTKRHIPAKTQKTPLVSVESSKTGKSINKNVPVAISTKASTVGKRLLADIIAIMKENRRSKMRSKQLLVHLCADPKKPWATCGRGGKNLNFRQLSALLQEFGIHSKDMRFNKKSYKGYQKEWFVEAKRSCRGSRDKTRQ
jgi:hypothetical protein